jgi:diguanylate cyclase (GGDEF)-like protein/PAS domain S-box-containing protein
MPDKPFGLVELSGGGAIQRASPSFCAWMQRSERSLAGTRFEDLLTPASQILHATHVVPLLEATGTVKEVLLEVVRADGHRFAIMVFAVRKHAADGAGHATTLSVFDATEIRRHAHELRLAKQRAEAAAEALRQVNAQLSMQSEELRITLRSIAEGVITLGLHGEITSINPAAQALFGIDESRAVHMKLECLGQFRMPASRLPLQTPDLLRMAGRFDVLLLTSSGSERHLSASVAHVRDSADGMAGAVVVIRDVTDERAMLHKLAYEASHDHLTGLANRREFENRLSALVRASKAGCHHVLYIDVDQFKVVNDIAGHEAGDQLLVSIADVLGANVRQGDTVARLGGDEFGLILPHCAEEAALRKAQRLRTQIAALRFLWKGRSFNVTVSIGMLSFGADATSEAAVLAGADMACHFAKEQGRNRIEVLADGDVRMQARRGEMTWATEIRRALEDERLRLHFQPIAPLKPGPDSLQHGEMLLRILDDEGHLLPPASFIQAAERYNQIQFVDRWVIETAFRWLSRHPGHEASINLSGQSIGDAQLLPFVLRQFERLALPPDRVCFEITETAAIADLPSALKFMNELRAIGVKFALDDFGIGMSSFSYLKTLPVDFVKIDGSFTRTLLTDPVNKGIVEAIVQIAKLCGCQTVAEWVETEDVREVLQRIGVDRAQGWLIGKPVPLDLQA